MLSGEIQTEVSAGEDFCAGIPDVGNMRPAAWISLHAPLKKLDGSFANEE